MQIGEGGSALCRRGRRGQGCRYLGVRHGVPRVLGKGHWRERRRREQRRVDAGRAPLTVFAHASRPLKLTGVAPLSSANSVPRSSVGANALVCAQRLRGRLPRAAMPMRADEEGPPVQAVAEECSVRSTRSMMGSRQPARGPNRSGPDPASCRDGKERNQAGFDIRQAPDGQGTDVTAVRIRGLAQAQQFADFLQRGSQRLAVSDEPEPLQVLAAIRPVAGRTPLRRRPAARSARNSALYPRRHQLGGQVGRLELDPESSHW